LYLTHLGELPENEISWILQSCDIAFSCTPFEYIGKSGAFASYCRHGLKVIVNNSNHLPEYFDAIEDYNTALMTRELEFWDVKKIGVDFIKILANECK